MINGHKNHEKHLHFERNCILQQIVVKLFEHSNIASPTPDSYSADPKTMKSICILWTIYNSSE